MEVVAVLLSPPETIVVAVLPLAMAFAVMATLILAEVVQAAGTAIILMPLADKGSGRQGGVQELADSNE